MRPRAVVERFISADCEPCWTHAVDTQVAADAWVLDWIVPGSRGDDAPLALAALPEARERTTHVAGLKQRADVPAVHRTALRARVVPRLGIGIGPAWKGYFGVQFDSRGRWPRGSTGWMALVESVPAGTDGTPVPRQLVRTVAGPFPPDGPARSHRETRALRWPETARPERLHGVAWVQAGDGQILAFARSDCAGRAAPN